MNASSTQEKEVILRDRQAEQYDKSFLQTRGRYGYASQVRTVLAHLKPQTHESILDAGSGTGVYSVEIAKAASRVLAVDFSPKSLEVLRSKIERLQITNIETKVGDLATVLLPAEGFDKAVSIEVLQHVPSHEKKLSVLQNIYNSLKPGGTFIMVVYRYGGWMKFPRPKEEFDHRGSGLYRLAFTELDCCSLLRAAGFHIDHIGGVLNVHKKIRKRLPPWMSLVDCWFSKLAVSRKVGDYFIVVAGKPS